MTTGCCGSPFTQGVALREGAPNSRSPTSAGGPSHSSAFRPLSQLSQKKQALFEEVSPDARLAFLDFSLLNLGFIILHCLIIQHNLKQHVKNIFPASFVVLSSKVSLYYLV